MTINASPTTMYIMAFDAVSEELGVLVLHAEPVIYAVLVPLLQSDYQVVSSKSLPVLFPLMLIAGRFSLFWAMPS